MTTRQIWVAVVAALLLGVTVDLVLDASRPGLIAGIGFFGCVGMVLGTKWLGRTLLQRPDTYWAETDRPEARSETHLTETDDA